MQIRACKFLVLSLLIFTTYSSEAQKISLHDLQNGQLPDTLIKDIPLDKRGKPGSYYYNKPEVEKKMGLKSLESGFDSIQIRLWYGYAFVDTSQLVVLTFENGQWHAELSSFVYHLTPKKDSILSISKSTEKKSPISGWDKFMKQLISLNILRLPDCHAIPGYYQSTDGNSIIVEIATKKIYRIYSYSDPSFHARRIKQARYMKKILEQIETEFGFKRLALF